MCKRQDEMDFILPYILDARKISSYVQETTIQILLNDSKDRSSISAPSCLSQSYRLSQRSLRLAVYNCYYIQLIQSLQLNLYQSQKRNIRHRNKLKGKKSQINGWKQFRELLPLLTILLFTFRCKVDCKMLVFEV